MSFQFQWWNIDIQYSSGRMTTEVKAKSRDHAIKQIQKMVKDYNSTDNQKLPVWFRKPRIAEVYWDTLKLDRTGYQRLY